jgi:DNA-binding MarR family transcriptional regulator
MRLIMMDRKKQIAILIENFHTIFQTLFKVAPSFINELKITPNQMIILSFVKQNEGISVKKLAGTMGITSSAATQQLNNLVKKGCLVREESNLDRRVIKIHLSGKISRKIEKIEATFLEQLFTVYSGITDEELALYCELNSKIADQIRQR